MSVGIGYQEYRELYQIKREKPGNERFLIYFGRAHVIDHLTGIEARGPMKIGRGKFASAIMRGRNQPGVDFRVYSEIILADNNSTYACEDIIESILEHRNIEMSQNQQELYDIKDEELRHTVETVVEVLKAELPDVIILDVKHYFDTDHTMMINMANTLERFF